MSDGPTRHGWPRRFRQFHAVRGTVGARLVIAMVGIAVSTVLTIVLLASNRGVTADIRAYIAQPSADLWVAPRGVDNFIRSAGLINPETTKHLGELEGVRLAAPILRSFVTIKPLEEHPGLPRGLNLMAVGYNPEVQLGGPPRFLTGEPPSRDRVAIDQAAAYRLGLARGDFVFVNEHRMRVGSITAGTNLIATQFAFLDLASVEHASGFEPGQASFVIIDVAEGADPEAVRKHIEDTFEDVSAHRVDEFLDNNLIEAMAGFEPFSRLVTVVGLIAAAALVAMLMQGIVEERKREVSVLLAMGASYRRIVGNLLLVAFLTTLGGVGIGSVLSLSFANATEAWFPTLTLIVHATDALIALAVFVTVAMVGAAIPLLRLRHIDPVESFRP